MSTQPPPKIFHKGRNIVIIIAIVIAIMIILFAPIFPVTETYKEQQFYQRSVTYVVDSAKCYESWNLQLGFYVQSEVVVRNTDSFGGTFKVRHELYDINGLFGSKTDTFYLGAGQSYKSIATFDTKMGQDTKGYYSVEPPTITDTRLVDKTRVVYKPLIYLNR
jgi:hypothetical protein